MRTDINVARGNGETLNELALALFAAWTLAHEGEALHSRAYDEAQRRPDGPYDDLDPVWERMDAGVDLAEVGDKAAAAIEARAVAAGIDVCDVLHLAEQYYLN